MTHEQIPAASQPPNDTITTPIVNSPLKDRRCSDHSSHFFAERDRRRNDDGVRLFQANSGSKRRKLNRVVPATTLLSFLHDNVINQCIEGYDGKVQDLSNTIKSALNSCSSKSPISFAPFKDLKRILENAPCPLKYNDWRMLLEDVLLLSKGQTVLTLPISRSHSILTSTITRAKRLRDLLFKKTIQFNPLQPVQFGKSNLFFALKLRVHSNGNYTDAKVSSYNIIISVHFHYHHSTHWFFLTLLPLITIIQPTNIHHHRTATYPLTTASVYLLNREGMALHLNSNSALILKTMLIDNAYSSPTW